MGEKLDRAQVNRWVLKKQHLTYDSKSGNILQVVNDIIGLHATDPLSPYLALYARMGSFRREELDGCWEKKKFLGKVRFVRKTVYILPKENLPMAFAAIRSMLEARAEVYLEHLGLTQQEYRRLCQKILSLFKGRGLTTKDVKAELDDVENISPLLNLMCDQGLLIRGLQRSGWLSNLHTYFAMTDYFPDIDLNSISEEKARSFIVRRYLEAFGPVNLDDIGWWTGFPKGEIRKFLQVWHSELCQVDISGLEGEYWMFQADRAQMDSEREDLTGEVSLLPLLDPYLMGYKARARFLRPEFFSFVYDRTGNATSTILVNGEVKGIWDYKAGKGTAILMHWFEEPEKKIRDIVQDKTKELGKFIFDGSVEVKLCHTMTPLRQRTMGGFLSPLKENE